MHEPRLLTLSPTSLALSASHMCCRDSRGAAWPAAPCSPPQLSRPPPPSEPAQPTAAGCRAWQLVCPLSLRAPTNHVVFASVPGIKAKFTGNHQLFWEFCGAERAPGSLQSHSHLLVYRHQLSLLKRHIFPVNLLLAQPLPSPCLQPLPRARWGARGCPEPPAGIFCSTWAKPPLLPAWKSQLRTTGADLSDPMLPRGSSISCTIKAPSRAGRLR